MIFFNMGRSRPLFVYFRPFHKFKLKKCHCPFKKNKDKTLPLFAYFHSFSQCKYKYSTNLAINEKV